MGEARPKPKKRGGELVPVYGSLDQVQRTLTPVEQGAIKSGLTWALAAIGTILFPQFALAVWAAYAVYQVGQHTLAMKHDYDTAHGTPEQRTIKMAVKEGFRVGFGAVVGELVGRQLHSAVESSVHTTADKLSEAGVFAGLATRIGNSNQGTENDLRYLYTGTATRVIEGAYQGVEDEISRYIEEKVID